MSRNTKLLAFALSLILISTILPAVQAQDTVTIEWWTVASAEFTEEAQRSMVAAFESENPGIKVNMTLLPENGFDEKMTTTLGAGSGAPDVAFFWNTNWLPQALDLTSFVEGDPVINPELYFPNFWNTRAVWNERVLGLPLEVGANVVLYNKDLFDAAGVPYPSDTWTTEDYIELTKRLQNPDRGIFGGDRPRGPFRTIWFQYGAFPYSDDSMTVEGYLNSEASVRAYTWLWDLVAANSTPTPADLEVLGTQGSGPGDLFLAGRIAMATLGQGYILEAQKAGMRFGVLPEPMAPGSDKRYVNAWSLTSSIWKDTQHPEEAWKFLSYWVGPQGQRHLMETSNLFPSIPSVLADIPNADAEEMQAFFSVLDSQQVASWDNPRPCKNNVLRAAREVWDLIMLGQIERDEIGAKLDALVPAAQAALDECRPRLGG